MPGDINEDKTKTMVSISEQLLRVESRVSFLEAFSANFATPKAQKKVQLEPGYLEEIFHELSKQLDARI